MWSIGKCGYFNFQWFCKKSEAKSVWRQKRSLNKLGHHLHTLLVTLLSLLFFRVLQESRLWNFSHLLERQSLDFTAEKVTPWEVRNLVRVTRRVSALPGCEARSICTKSANLLTRSPAPAPSPGLRRRSKHSTEDVLNHTCVHFFLAPGQIHPLSLAFKVELSFTRHDLALVSLWMSLSVHNPPSGPSLQPRLWSYSGFGYTDCLLASGIFSYLSQPLNLF